MPEPLSEEVLAELRVWARVDTRSETLLALLDDHARLRADEGRLQRAGLVWDDVDRLFEHWAECPAPPDAGCGDCHAWYRARRSLRDLLSHAEEVTTDER